MSDEFDYDETSTVEEEEIGWESVSEEPEKDSEEEDDEGEFLDPSDYNKTPIKFGDLSPLDGEECSCKNLSNKNEALSLLSMMVDITPTFDNINCIIDNIIRCYNMIFLDGTEKKRGTWACGSKKIAFADLFYRFRHELLFKLLCLTFNLPVSHSDIRFREFGIPSDRTPDLILEENGVIKIIEVTAVSSMEKASQNKGYEQMGFESKYKKEIEMLIDLGKTCVYLPVFFDMSGAKSTVNSEQILTLKCHFPKINEAFRKLMEITSNSLAMLTCNFKNTLILPSTILFSEISPVKPNHESLSFLYKRSRQPIKVNHYKELTVSPYVYNKIINDRQRFYWMLDNNKYTDTVKLIFIINTVSHRISLEPNVGGLKNEELRQILMDNDIIKILRYTKVKIGNTVLPSTDSETGVKFYERSNKDSSSEEPMISSQIPLISNHACNNIVFRPFDTSVYKSLINSFKTNNYHSMHYSSEYEDVLINSMVEFDSTRNDHYDVDEFPNLLGNLRSSDIDIDKTMADVEVIYKEKNRFGDDLLPMKKGKMKQPFILPIADLNESSYCQLDNKNIPFIDKVVRLIEVKNPYTALILRMVVNDSYNMYNVSKAASSTLNGMMAKRFEISNSLNQLQKRMIRDNAVSEGVRLSKVKDDKYRIPYLELTNNFKVLNKEINNRKKSEGVGANISYLRLPTKQRGGHLRKLYDFEMEHFKDRKKQSTIEGVGIINNIKSDYESDLNVFQELCTLMCEDRGYNPDKVLDEYVSDDASLIYDLKNQALENYKGLIEQVRRSYLGHAAALISRIAHSLMFYSQLPFSSDYVRVDNLGYKNVLLIVKGGKKIFKSKSSKLFRLIFPISEEIIPWYTIGHRDTGSFTLLNINGSYFGMTPWSFMHESILTDSISFYSRVSSFTFLNLNPKLDLKSQFPKLSMNILLSFHNRRQTEVMLANMRYILLSTLGDFTGVSQIMGDFFDFNYDRFQAFIRNSLLLNYPVYFKQLQNLKDSKFSTGKDINISDFVEARLKNIFTLEVVSKVEDLALMIYSTFLMTKAPYQKVAERARNLRGILEIHELFNKEVGLKHNAEKQTEIISVENTGDFTEYTNNLFKSDFNFDPKFCALVGNFIDSIFVNNGEVDDISTSWVKIMNQPWDEMATSTGLRGDYNDLEDFWGQKGYFVIYKSLLAEPGFSDKLKSIFLGEFDEDTKRKILRGMNEVYLEKFCPDREFLIFHAVDKVQWRGGREIYVMDLLTKTMQQPIEKFMAMLCKKLDNELISIPSDRRAQVIHHSIFEKDLPLKDMLTWYLTLDCSKWAPKSVFIKFVVTILNMSCVPNTFKTHFMNYIEKLYSKRIYFNVAEVLALKKNLKYKNLVEKYMVEDTHVKGYYIEMPYSWVMGIFNYTSSFLHAANQKYFSYLLMKTSLITYKEETSLVMFAHSDDSGGRLSASNICLAKRGVILYEIFLKSCNHLLSKKKSVISRIYFEILSVIYIFKKLLALLPKFLGGLRFLPTDKGPAQDMLQSYSKSIEVMIAGSDFSISYLVLKVYSYIVWRFYYHKDPSKSDYERPVQYLGLPDAHPLFILLCGSDADILRLIRNGVKLERLISFINTMSQQMDGEGPIKPLKFEIKVKGIKKGFEDYIDCFKEDLKSWSVRNVNYHNTAMNTLSFLRKLNDSGFVGSLVNESTVRRISRGYFIRSGDSAITRFGNIKLSVLLDSINLCQSYSSERGHINMLFKDVLSETAIEDIEKDFENCRLGSEKLISLTKETLRSPLRVYKYLDMLSLKDRKINESFRTLKPTQVQLVKSARVFSTKFDPASLVSYIKEPSMRWCLPNVRGIITAELEVKDFLNKLGYNLDEIDPDMLLRVCRTYGVDNTKNIYLYSRVPGDIKQIKTYAAFLTFLSVNSFTNKEILGLTLKLNDREMDREYVQPNVREEVYLVNNVISLLLTLNEKCGLEFIKDIRLNPIEEIEWAGGLMSDLLSHVESLCDTDVRYALLKAQLYYLKFKLGETNNSANFLNQAAYFTFLKSQKSRGGWYGKGEIYIRLENNFYSFILENNDVVSVYTNKIGKLPQHHSEYILDIFSNNNININSMKKPKYSNYNQNHLGFDNSNDISVLPGREISLGVPSTALTGRNEFVDNLDYFELVDYRNNNLTLRSGYEGNYVYRKISLLPIKKAELVGTIKSLLNAKDFEDKIIEFGINDFEEFIYTEILTEYGKEIYIDFNELFDNFAASKIYNVFRETHEKSYSIIPKSVNFSPLPASEGSLVRILIDYSRLSGDNVINVPFNLDSAMMQIRAEYPEQMATVLGEHLDKYHKQIYSTAERKEITDNYDIVSKEKDVEKRKMGVIKLMSFWGYGSLVHNIKTFTLSRSIENYSFFNFDNLNKAGGYIYSDVFEFLIKSLNKLLLKWRPMFKSLDPPLNIIARHLEPDDLINNYMYSVVMQIYNFRSLNIRVPLYQLQYMNTLLSCMQEEDFIAEMHEHFKENYIVSSLPLSWNLRYELIATINTLQMVWTKMHKTEFDLNYINKLQRLPDNVQNYKGLLRSFDVNLRGRDTLYNGFLKDSFISYLFSLGNVFTEISEYRLNIKITQKSDIEINMTEEVKHPRPILPEVLEESAWEDYNYELSMPEVDLDEVEAIKEDLPEKIYKDPEVRRLKIKGKNITMASIYFIINPNCTSTDSPIPYFRQVGENIVVITESFLPRFTKVFPNSGLRILNPSKILKENSRPVLLYYSFNKALYNDKSFIDRLLKGQELNLNVSDFERVRSNWIRSDTGKICDPVDQGFEDATEIITGEKSYSYGDGVIVIKNKEEATTSKTLNEGEGSSEGGGNRDSCVGKTPEAIREDKELEELNKIKLTINAVENENIISSDSIKMIKNKYLNKSLKKGVPMSVLLRSILEETDLMKMNNDTLSNKMEIGAKDQKQMFLSPGYFSLGRSVNRVNINPIKDKKLRSELNSFHPDLANSIGSNTLRLSKKFSKVILANVKFWLLTIKNSKLKTDNKKFLFNLFITICNNVMLSDDEDDDPMWQQIVNKVSLYISDDGDDNDDEEFFNMVFNILPASRIRYRSEGT